MYGLFCFKGDTGVDLKIFLLHKNDAILEGLEVFFNMIDTDFGVTVHISTFEPDEAYNVYTMVTDDSLFDGYGIIIFNTFNDEYVDTIRALNTNAPESIVFTELAIQMLVGECCHSMTEDFCSDLQRIIEEDYMNEVFINTQHGQTILNDVRSEKTIQLVRLKNNPFEDNEDDDLPLDDDNSVGSTAGVDINIKEMLAAQVAGFHLQNNDLEDVKDGITGDTSESVTEEEHGTNGVPNVIISEVTETDESKGQVHDGDNQGEIGEPASVIEEIEITNVVENDTESDIDSDYSREAHIIEGAATERHTVVGGNDEVSNEPQDEVSFERARLIQKQLFAKQHWEGHKSIGIWSPLPKMGVTTFAINYAIFLAENRIYAGVLEGLKNEPMLKHWIKRYTPIPKEWTSYAKAVHSTADDSFNADWTYRNVLYLPLDDEDSTLQWSADKLAMYLNTPALMDVTLVDLPSGVMHEYTYHSLYYLSELWVIVDDTYQEIMAWKQYIHAIQKKYDLKVKLVFNKQYEFSQVKRLAESLDLDVICTLPALHEEVMRNYYETQPLLFSKGVREQLFEPFVGLTKYLMGKGKGFTIQTTVDNQTLIPSKEEDNNWTAFIEKFKRWLKDLS